MERLGTEQIGFFFVDFNFVAGNNFLMRLSLIWRDKNNAVYLFLHNFTLEFMYLQFDSHD